MLEYEEKVERIELIDAVTDVGRLARGLDQLLESMAHADQLDPLDVEGIVAALFRRQNTCGNSWHILSSGCG